MKCFKDFEFKKKSIIIYFQCEKQFDIKNGFILYDKQKFCSSKCKEEYIKENSLGIEVDYVIDYESAIEKLIENGYCNYYACLVLNEESYAKLPRKVFKKTKPFYYVNS